MIHDLKRRRNNGTNTLEEDIEETSEQVFVGDDDIETSNSGDTYFSIFNPEEIAFRSEITGVIVWARARLRRILRRRCRYKESNVPDISVLEEELQAEEEKVLRSDPKGKRYHTELLNNEKCGKRYRIEGALMKHHENCSGTQGNQDAISRACRMAFSMLDSQDAPVYTTKDIHPSVLSMPIEADTFKNCRNVTEWAQRPAYGHTLGQKHGEQIRDRFANMVYEG